MGSFLSHIGKFLWLTLPFHIIGFHEHNLHAALYWVIGTVLFLYILFLGFTEYVLNYRRIVSDIMHLWNLCGVSINCSEILRAMANSKRTSFDNAPYRRTGINNYMHMAYART